MNIQTYIKDLESKLFAECPFCRGIGTIDEQDARPASEGGWGIRTVPCPDCGGKGTVYRPGQQVQIEATEILKWLQERAAWETVMTLLVENKQVLENWDPIGKEIDQEIGRIPAHCLPADEGPHELCPGAFVTIKKESWEQAFPEKPYDDRPQRIMLAPLIPPLGDYFLLALPYHWWKAEDLELAKPDILALAKKALKKALQFSDIAGALMVDNKSCIFSLDPEKPNRVITAIGEPDIALYDCVLDLELVEERDEVKLNVDTCIEHNGEVVRNLGGATYNMTVRERKFEPQRPIAGLYLETLAEHTRKVLNG